MKPMTVVARGNRRQSHTSEANVHAPMWAMPRFRSLETSPSARFPRSHRGSAAAEAAMIVWFCEKSYPPSDCS